MIENFLNILKNFSILDFIFILFLIFNSLIGLQNGFVLSLLSFLKWILSLISTKIFLPYLTYYTKNLIQTEFTHDLIFGSIIFFLSLFFIILISKGLKKTMTWTGLGNVDKLFGFIFGFFKGYVYFVLIFSLTNFIHPYNKWNIELNSGKFFNSIVTGVNFLEENLSRRYEYIEKSKENVDKISK